MEKAIGIIENRFWYADWGNEAFYYSAWSLKGWNGKNY